MRFACRSVADGGPGYRPAFHRRPPAGKLVSDWRSLLPRAVTMIATGGRPTTSAPRTASRCRSVRSVAQKKIADSCGASAHAAHEVVASEPVYVDWMPRDEPRLGWVTRQAELRFGPRKPLAAQLYARMRAARLPWRLPTQVGEQW